MKYKVYKAYIDFKKEEDWLNKMSASGMHLVDYTICRYVFEPGEPGKYIYRLELLKAHPGNAEGAAYIRFMEENGVECVSTYMRWAYFRKRAADGPFEIYSDLEGKIKHYQRIVNLMITLFLLNLGCALTNLSLGLGQIQNGMDGYNAYLSTLNFVVGTLLCIVACTHGKALHRLKIEKKLRE